MNNRFWMPIAMPVIVAVLWFGVLGSVKMDFEFLGGGVDDEIDAIVDEFELGVRDEHRNLHDRVPGGVEPGHLEVDPREVVGMSWHGRGCR